MPHFLPAFQCLREARRTTDAAAVYLHTVCWYRGSKTHHTTAVVCRHGKTLRILLKRYSIFTRLLRPLYDFPPPVCHTPQCQGGRRLSSQTHDGRYASHSRSLPRQPSQASAPTARGGLWWRSHLQRRGQSFSETDIGFGWGRTLLSMPGKRAQDQFLMLPVRRCGT